MTVKHKRLWLLALLVIMIAGGVWMFGRKAKQTELNYAVFDFALSDEEMSELTAIDRDERFADY